MNRKDELLTITLLGGQVRVLMCDTTQMVEKARETHALSRVATAALGRHLTAAAMMGTMLKNERDTLTVSIRGSGPLGAIVAVARPGGVVKGYVTNPHEEIAPRADGKLDVAGAVGREGRLTVVKDLGMREPYVGQVNLVSGEIAKDFAYYFTISEQTPSLVALGVMAQDAVSAAGGMIIQPMPGCGEGMLTLMEMRTPEYGEISQRLKKTGLRALMEEYFEGMEPEILESTTPRYECDCGVERVSRALITLGEAEIEDMIKKQGGAHVSCQFCLKEYFFGAGDLRELVKAARETQR